MGIICKYRYTALLLLCCISFIPKASAQSSFRFAFTTDIHLNNHEKANAFDGWQMAINNIQRQKVDFILTGGDNVDIDVLKNEQKNEAEGLYTRFKKTLTDMQIPFHVTMGNHDRFWAKASTDSTLNDDGMFKKFFNKTYYSFEHKGWKFFILNSLQTENNIYPVVNNTQLDWIKETLKHTPKNQPIIISTHVPLQSVYYPVLYSKYTDADVLKNQQEILKVFEDYNLKLVLQGHMHLYEEIKVKNIQFITAGAVSANWWGGNYYGTEEGYLLIDINGNDFSWKYIDYGWNVEK